jgi:multimeric flavodoxin WrbA
MNILYIIDGRNTDNTAAHIQEMNKNRFGNDSIKIFNLGEIEVKQCVGCFSCWLKTPGKCIFKDSMEEIYYEVTKSDIMIFVSPIKTGFITSRVKTLMERLIPLLLPYFRIINNEFHHRERYKKYPELEIILEKNADTEEKDLEIIKKFFERFSINFYSKVKKFDVLEKRQEVLKDVAGNI